MTLSHTITGLTSFGNVLLLSILVRVALILYSEYHDARSLVKYTDVDYRVFSDAAWFMLHPGPEDENRAKGILGYLVNIGDPYTRDTYRYTPLLALLLTPNDFFHPSTGKYLFAACDIIGGILIYKILISSFRSSTSAPEKPTTSSANPSEPPKPPRTVSDSSSSSRSSRRATLYTTLHLLNPLVFSISTRGSSESVLSLFVLLTLYSALKDNWDLAAVWLGVSVHWKIYPMIYGFACVSALGGARGTGIGRYFNRRVLRFGVVSVSTFGLLSGLCYLVWGYPFLYESYLYHLHRLDHRHNFSPYFYLTYLTYPTLDAPFEAEELSIWTRILQSPLTSFLPQMLLSIGSGLMFGRYNYKKHFPFTWFVQTVLFVVFNKVCTSQYFLWYLLFLPLILPRVKMSRIKVILCIGVWVGTQALWLAQAYKLEFLGENVFYGLWVRGCIYVAGNCWVLAQLAEGYDVEDVAVEGGNVASSLRGRVKEAYSQ